MNGSAPELRPKTKLEVRNIGLLDGDEGDLKQTNVTFYLIVILGPLYQITWRVVTKEDS